MGVVDVDKGVVRGVVGDRGIEKYSDDDGGTRGMRRKERKQRASRKGTAKERLSTSSPIPR
jgi:hypothetical protein